MHYVHRFLMHCMLDILTRALGTGCALFYAWYSDSWFSIWLQARLAFCKFMVKPSTLLVLDEPTNHLDIPSKEMLEVPFQPWISLSHFYIL